MLETARWPVIFLAALALAACQSTPMSMSPVPAKVTDGAMIDPTGKTLYTFAKDVTGTGKSECNGPCANLWPPFPAAAGALPTGSWTIITRDDGAKQWAYKGKPLYTFAKDTKAGDRSGQNYNNMWNWATE
jgi:predicted lipoprotein with Yx(FWY)xxD motif